MLPAFIILGIVSLIAIRTDHHRHPENPGSLTTAGRIGAGVALTGAFAHCARLLEPQPEHEIPLSFVAPPVSIIIPSTSTIAPDPTGTCPYTSPLPATPTYDLPRSSSSASTYAAIASSLPLDNHTTGPMLSPDVEDQPDVVQIIGSRLIELGYSAYINFLGYIQPLINRLDILYVFLAVIIASAALSHWFAESCQTTARKLARERELKLSSDLLALGEELARLNAKIKYNSPPNGTKPSSEPAHIKVVVLDAAETIGAPTTPDAPAAPDAPARTDSTSAYDSETASEAATVAEVAATLEVAAVDVAVAARAPRTELSRQQKKFYARKARLHGVEHAERYKERCLAG